MQRSTILFSVLVVGIPVIIYFVYAMARTHGAPPIPGAGFGFLSLSLTMLVIWLSAFAFSPRGYLLTSDELRVVRIAPCIHVKYTEMAHVGLVDGEEVFRNSVKLASSKGAFGNYGRFFGAYLPEFQAYVTNTGRLTVITRKHDVPLVLSPDETDKFLQLLQEHGGAVN